MDAPAQWDEPGKEFYRTNAIADILRAGGTIPDSATYEEVRRYQAGFRDMVPSSIASAAGSARRAASDAHAEDDNRQQQLKRKPVVTKR
jgi:hypothetical protein